MEACSLSRTSRCCSLVRSCDASLSRIHSINASKTASGDPRHIFKTLANLPAEFDGSLEVIINDNEPHVVARNLIMLLVALTCEPAIATEMILHLWYSLLIPSDTYQKLQNDILPLIADVLAKIANKPASSAQSKTWEFGQSKLNLTTTKAVWQGMPTYITGCAGMTQDGAIAAYQAVTMAANLEADIDVLLYRQLPGWRVAKLKFHQEGLLLPFGASRAEFTTPNL